MTKLNDELSHLLALIERRERDVERMQNFCPPAESREGELFRELTWPAMLRDLRKLHALLSAAAEDTPVYGPCGMRNIADDCDCEGAGGDR